MQELGAHKNQLDSFKCALQKSFFQLNPFSPHLSGLCMGFSLISGAEILFHSSMGIFSAFFPAFR